MLSTSQTTRSRLVQAVSAARRIFRDHEEPSQGPFEQVINTALFVAHTQNLPSLRGLYGLLGRRARVFGGETYPGFAEAHELMARELEKIDWFSGPLQDRADYLTKSYTPFLLQGPNHDKRRAHIVARVAEAHRQLEDLEALLDQEVDANRAFARFMFRHFCRVELNADEVTWFLEFRERAQPMILLPKWMRTSLLRVLHEKLEGRRQYFLARIEDAGEPIADSWFDAMWFNGATLGFYPEKALETLVSQVRLRAPIRDESMLPPGERPLTRALIHEMLRIYGRIASTNYVEQGRVRVALLATAVVDPARYHAPLTVDLSRDHSDTLAFAGPSPTRKCPAELFAPDAMACVVAHRVRNGWLETHQA